MVYLLGFVAYVAFIVFTLRFFESVHECDDEIRLLTQENLFKGRIGMASRRLQQTSPTASPRRVTNTRGKHTVPLRGSRPYRSLAS